MDRISFFESINGIQYPEMLVNFFDHFVALKQLVEDDYASIETIDSKDNNIKFRINFNSSNTMKQALDTISSANNSINIYGRCINIQPEVLTDSSVQLNIF